MPTPQQSLRTTTTAAAKAFVLILIAQLPIGLIPLASPLVGSLVVVGWSAAVAWAVFQHHTTEEMFLEIRVRSRGLSRQRWPRVAVIALLFAAASIAFQVLYLSFVARQGDASDIELSMNRPGGWLPVMLLAVVLGPVVEEAAIRGYFQSRMQERYGPRAAVLLGALLFGVAHLSPLGFPFYFVEGVVLGIVVLRTGSIWASAALHGAGNLAVGLLSLRFGAASSPADLPHRSGLPLTYFVIALAALALLLVRMIAALESPRDDMLDRSDTAPLPAS